MTILTAKVTERKDDIPPPEVVSDYAFLIDNEKNAVKSPKSCSAAVVVNVPPSHVDAMIRRRQRSVWLTIVSLFVLIAIILGCICMYKNLLSAQQTYSGRCGVRYHERISTSSYSDRLKGEDGLLRSGEFSEDVEIGDDDYEKIFVPPIGDIRRATVLHDFNVNYTAVVDKDQSSCLLIPLNRSMVLPPRDFWDLLVKLKTGYYVPDVNVVRENYRVVTPAIEDLTPYGMYIKSECRYFTTYRLVKEGEPIGLQYSLGDAGRDKLLFFNIAGCL